MSGGHEIKTKAELLNTIRYIANQTSQMCKEIVGITLPIKSLTVFCHDENEFEHLKEILNTMGAPYNENNGPRITLSEPIIVNEHTITHVRIRHPDILRPHVGCNDFEVNSYVDFKNTYLHSPYLKLIQRPTYEMIEFRHPAYDVLAYVVSK